MTSGCLRTSLRWVLAGLFIAACLSLPLVGAEDERPKQAEKERAADEDIDWNRARALLRKERGGEKLTEDEAAYLRRAKEVRAKMQRQGRRPDARPQAGERPQQISGKESTGLIPLPDMPADAEYKGQSGGLYGHGRNTPPEAHLKAALEVAKQIQPLDADGKPDPNGKIVLISNGMSNTTQHFSAFMKLAASDADKSSRLVIVDGAFGGQEAGRWANAPDKAEGDGATPWQALDRRLGQAGVSPQQVQVLWVLQARAGPAALGAFPKHAEALKENLVTVLNRMKTKFPNLRIAYLSNRIYAGYATGGLNPEPFAYESAFANRWLIDEQIEGRAELNYDPSKGEVKSPLLLWGPYLWADGVKGRKGDGLAFTREDLAGDGTHPSQSGRQKVAKLLLEFFKTDATAKGWFVGIENR